MKPRVCGQRAVLRDKSCVSTQSPKGTAFRTKNASQIPGAMKPSVCGQRAVLRDLSCVSSQGTAFRTKNASQIPTCVCGQRDVFVRPKALCFTKSSKALRFALKMSLKKLNIAQTAIFFSQGRNKSVTFLVFLI